jgi:hypothetical protein
MLQSANLLAKLYEPLNLAEANRFLKIAHDINNEVYGLKKTQNLQKLVLEEREHQLKAEQDQIEYKNRSGLPVYWNCNSFSNIYPLQNKRKKSKQSLN